MPDLVTASAIIFPARAAPAIVGFVPYATANRLICSAKRLESQKMSGTKMNCRSRRKVCEGAAMTAGKAARMTCILYQVLPSSSDELQQRLQAALDPKEQTTRIDVQVIKAARALE